MVRPFANRMTALRGLSVISLLVLSTSVKAATPTPSASVSLQATPTPAAGTPTPTGTRVAGEVHIAIDNLVARGVTTFSTNFDAFAAGTFAENLSVSGVTFAPDPPGSWQIVDASANPFGAPFQLLSGEVLAQSMAGTLIITFTSPVNTFTCAFAMNQPRGASGVFVQTYHGTTQTSSLSQLTTVGTVIGEGTINLNTATAFDKVRLSSLAATVTPTPTPTTGSGTGPRDLTKTPGTPNTTPNPSGMTAGTGGSGCSITASESALPPVLLALPFLIVAALYRRV